MPKEKSEDWEHVLISDKKDNGCLSKLICIYCTKRYQGGIARIRSHLIGDLQSGISKCSKVPYEVQQNLKNKQSMKQEAEAKKRRFDVLDRATKDVSFETSASRQMTLPAMLVSTTKEAADKAIARLFYASGIPFCIADSSYFKAAITAVTQCNSDYKAPNRNKLSTTMLVDEISNVEKSISMFKETFVNHGVTIVSDGWTNVQNKSLINFLAVSSDSCIFLNALDTSGKIKDGSFIAGEISKSIESYGMESVVQVITDSASNCVAARTILQHQYPKIVFSPCAVHCLDLLLEDIGKLSWMNKIIMESKNIVKFITTHQFPQACFRNHSDLELLKPTDTRFATHFIMLQRLYTAKDSLQETVTSREYKIWLSDAVYKKKGETVTSAILNENFWSSVKLVTDLCEPIIKLLRLADGNVPCIGKIYWKMYQINQYLERYEISSEQKTEINKLFMKRWKMLHTDLHAAGFVLDPEYCNLAQHQNEVVNTGFHNIIEKIFSDNIQSQVKAVQQYATYRAGHGMFARQMAIAAAKEMPAYRWWMSFGAHVPELQHVAIRVLAQVTSASSCERNWSTFDFIHTKKRNRMKCERVRDIVFVHANLRLKDKVENINYMENTIEWSNQSSDEDDVK